MNVRIHVAYDGSRYHGWQVQPDARTVEGELTRALQTILGAPEPVKVQGASRTDAGVHSLGQVAAFRHDTPRTLWDFSRGLNALTDEDICVTRVEQADEDFHARHSARGKIYRYQVWNHRFAHPFERTHTWHQYRELDIGAMGEAAARFVGVHDFSAFRASDCESETTEREMRRVEVRRDGHLVEVVVEGTAFLKYMVRVMVGTLVDVGSGRMRPEAISDILQCGDRRRAGQTAPAQGLTLMQVHYPDFPWDDPPELGGKVVA